MHQLYEMPCQVMSFQFMNGFSTNESQSVNDYLLCLEALADKYRTNNLMITAGYDFSYQQAELTYGFIENLIKRVK